MIKAVLFDLDGTLLDTSEGIIHSVRYTINTISLAPLPESTILRFVGPPIQNSLMSYCGLNPEEAQKGANVFREFYKNNALFEAKLYDGVIDLLDILKEKGIKLGVATYKREDYAIDLLKHFGIDGYCDVIHGADNNNVLTKTDIIELCIKEIGVDRDTVFLVGDTEHDAKGAYQANVPFIAVTWGFGYRVNKMQGLYPCTAFANHPLDILTALNIQG